jgi:hypothetical protein
VPEVKPVRVVLVPEPFVVVPPGVVVIVHVPELGKPVNSILPVATEQVGCVTVPITGVLGDPGTVLIAADVDAVEVQLVLFVTVKVYVFPGFNPVKLAVVPVPEIVVPPGEAVTVQDPEAGSPLKATVPVGDEHVGCVIVPTNGAVGTIGAAFRAAEVDIVEEHTPLLTVNVYVALAARPVIVPVVPVPVAVTPPGAAVTVHVPDAGSPLKSTLPVGVEQVGCVIVPTIGADGTVG